MVLSQVKVWARTGILFWPVLVPQGRLATLVYHEVPAASIKTAVLTSAHGEACDSPAPLGEASPRRALYVPELHMKPLRSGGPSTRVYRSSKKGHVCW